MSLDIFLTNNLTNKKEKFIPKDKNNVRMYVCGPTVYDDPHIGNARPVVVFDILFKILKNKYPNVTYVRNITDVDDKIIKSSKENNISISELTKKITQSFNEDCIYLNCEQPNHEPKATEHISEMIEMISELIKKGFAYENNKHVYFEVKKFKDYGQLSNKKLDELVAGSRIEVSDNKKNPEDFVLWKPSESDEPSWESPWGKGRPGWHLECSAMSKKYLGNEFDVHGGGVDLLFPHHENEIAQSCSNNSTKNFANYWIHNGFVTINKEKMSKSLGNVITISDAVNKYSGQVVRLALLSAHYSQPLDWNDKLLSSQENTLKKWYSLYSEQKENYSKIDEILLDDLNTPGLMANINKLLKNAESLEEGDKPNLKSNLLLIGKLMGILEDKSYNQISSEFKDKVDNLIKDRSNAKKKRDFELADKIRSELIDLGVEINDSPEGTTWKVVK